jgi:Kef-type K+ transport system membrane component KefB
MIYVLAVLLPPLGLLLNGQPLSAIFNLVLIVLCLVFGLIFHEAGRAPASGGGGGDPPARPPPGYRR